jgi:deoxycytidylate deaminase
MRALSEHDYFKSVAVLTSQRAGTFGKCGAVICREGVVLSTGYNQPEGDGIRHAEVDALCNAKGGAHGATEYVTLAPCLNCAHALVEAGVTKVFCGLVHPNVDYKVAEGLALLRESGVEVEDM